MQRKYFGIAIAAFATLVPATVWGGDKEIAKQIITRLNESRDSGQLKDFTLDMKVDKGVVLFRGNVGQDVHKKVVLNSADGIDGIAKIVDEVSVVPPAAVVKRQVSSPLAVTEPAAVVKSAAVVKPFAVAEPSVVVTPAFTQPIATAPAEKKLTLAEALAAEARTMQNQSTPDVVPGEILPTAAYEESSDQQVVSGVINALQTAKRNGQLRGFGVDVKSRNGVLQLTGRAGSADQRDQILRIAESVPGVSGVRDAITIPSRVEDTQRLPSPQSLQTVEQSELTPLNPPVQMARRNPAIPAMAASTGQRMPAMTAPYRMPAQQGAPTQAIPAAMGYGGGMGMQAPVMGQPVPMAPHSPVGAPRYDSPNLPNYAWPGYAAHPNYAALTYPQQYSPSAWPYIGPFYPYPQVPLGWRKISLEWDDGWWFLDFTDK